MSKKRYIPALRYNWLTSFYDPLIRFTLREMRFKGELIAQANIKKGQRVLDVGCGTATLLALIKGSYPDLKIVGIDGDPKILEIAKVKIKNKKMQVTLDHGLATQLPYKDSSFDHVFTSLVLHHLNLANKKQALKEIHRVLKPGGTVNIADWGEPQNIFMRLAFYGVQLLDGFETTADNVSGQIPIYLKNCGFKEVKIRKNFSTVVGTLSLLQGLK